MCLISYVRSYLCVIFIILGFIDISSTLPDGFACFQRGPCSCAGSNGEILDLSPLANTSQPLIVSTNASLYIYHPCTDIRLNAKDKNNTCQKDFGMCYFFPNGSSNKPLDYNNVLLNITLGTFEKLAVNSEAVFRVNQMKQIEIVYKHTTSTTKTTYVKLDCNEDVDGYKLIIEKTNLLEHILTLTSRHACVKTPHYMSGGAVFFIIVLVIFALYFIGGILVLKFIRGATGVEMIPNHEFWCNLPRMAKDGVAYVRNRGKNAPDSYETI